MEYTAFAIGSKVYRINLIFPKSTQSVKRETHVVEVMADGQPITLKVTTPALWEELQVPIVNPWELNDQLVKVGLIDADARISPTALPVGQAPQYVLAPIKAVNRHIDNVTTLDEISENELPSETLEDQMANEAEMEADILDDGLPHTKALGAG